MANYIKGLNIENCNQLLNWLDDGAPHAVFNMDFCNMPLSVVTGDDIEADTDDATRRDEIILEAKTKGIGECGTVCCIAGAAAGMTQGDISKPLEEIQWHVIADTAIKFLGIEKQNTLMSHDLFDNCLAPENCTPAQAAAALRRVMVGEEAWPKEEDEV